MKNTGLVVFSLLLSGTVPSALQGSPYKADRIDIQYVAPKNSEHRPLFEVLKEHRALERLRDVLRPFRLPRRLLIKVEGCDGDSNAWYEEGAVTVCYEFLDAIWKNESLKTTPAGLAPIDTLVGPTWDVFLHEVGHAMFEYLRVPVLGREEDAADYFSAYLMLKHEKAEARRLIMGNAHQYKSDLQTAWRAKDFSDEHGTPAQRFYNVLCLAYGADQKLFQDIVDNGFLPKDRAEGCDGEYKQVAYAIERLIRPFFDRKLEKRLHKSWLPPVTTPPPHRPVSATMTSQ